MQFILALTNFSGIELIRRLVSLFKVFHQAHNSQRFTTDIRIFSVSSPFFPVFVSPALLQSHRNRIQLAAVCLQATASRAK
jgi:hypothetical protein